MSPPRLRIVGCGHPDAGDDAVGLLLADQLRARWGGTIEIRQARGGARLLDGCDQVEGLILVDAALATDGFPPGAWRLFRFPEDRGCLAALPRAGTHVLGVVPALDLALALNRLPAQVRLFVVAGSEFALGKGLSPAVRESLPQALAALEAEVRRLESAYYRATR